MAIKGSSVDLKVYSADSTGQAAVNRDGATGSERKLAKILGERHPHWEELHFQWQRFTDLYEGTNLQRYIHRHARESRESHRQRTSRIAYRNYIEAVVSLPRHYIFSKKINRTALPKELEKAMKEAQESGDPSKVMPHLPPLQRVVQEEWENEFLHDVDRCGTPMDRFMGDIGELAFLLGKQYVLVDQPKVQNIRSEADRKGLNVRPYLIRYSPLQMVNWELDEDGKLAWCRFLEVPSGNVDPLESRSEKLKQGLARSYAVPDPAKPAYMNPTTERTSGDDFGRDRSHFAQGLAEVPVIYRTWTKKDWSLHRVEGDKATLIDKGTHSLGEVPVVNVWHRKAVRYPFGGVSAVQDIVGLAQQILNMDSLIDEAVYQQTLSILVMGRQPIEGQEIVVSESNVLEVAAGSFPPYYLTPSQAPLQYMEQRNQILAQEIFRLSKFGGSYGIDAKAVAPTTAAYEFNLTNRTLAEKADNLEAAENEIHRLYFKWFDMDFPGSVSYADDFSVSSFQEDLQALIQAKQGVRSPMAIREMEKKVVRKMLNGLPDETREEIDGEIDFVPQSIETFSGPIWYDQLTQAVNAPGSGAPPVGKLGEIVTEYRQKGQEPPPGMTQQRSPEQELQLQQQQISVQQQAAAAEGEPQAQEGEPKEPAKAERKEQPAKKKPRRRRRKEKD